MDISSEMIHAVVPIYLVTALGTPTLIVGFIEGIAAREHHEDVLWRAVGLARQSQGADRNWLRTGGVHQTNFPLATSVGCVVAARFIDRIGRGVRDAPRNALIADLAQADLRGASFGLPQALDTVGALVGPLAAIALMARSSNNFHVVFWIAVVRAFIALSVIVFAVKEPSRHEADTELRLADAKRLPGRFWVVIGVATILTLARFSVSGVTTAHFARGRLAA